MKLKCVLNETSSRARHETRDPNEAKCMRDNLNEVEVCFSEAILVCNKLNRSNYF